MLIRSRVFFAALLAVCCAAASLAADDAEKAVADVAKRDYKKAAVIKLEGMVSPQMETFLKAKLKSAKQRGADLVIFEIDSPGGYVDTTFAIGDLIRDLDWAHTVAYIPREALSGASLLSFGADEIVLDDNAMFGDAGAVEQQGFFFRYAPEKYKTHVVGKARALAAATGRPPAFAEAMVDKDIVVYAITENKTGDVQYLTETEWDELNNREPDAFTQGDLVHESRMNFFFEVTGKRAHALGLADGIAHSRRELLEQYNVEDDFFVLQWTTFDTIIMVLNWWIVSIVLIVVGLIALYIEMSAPGLSIGGLVAGLCFVIFFWARFMGGTAEILEVLLFGVGVVFVMLEIFVIPGWGAPGILGLLLMISSVVLAGQDFVIPHSKADYDTLRNSLLMIVGSGCLFIAGAAVVTRYMGSIPGLSQLVLKPKATAEEPAANTDPKPGFVLSTGDQLHVGDWGTSESALRPAGKAIFGDEYVDVITDGSYVDPNVPIKIVRISGNVVTVREVKEKV